jgi:hypothetical protein
VPLVALIVPVPDEEQLLLKVELPWKVIVFATSLVHTGPATGIGDVVLGEIDHTVDALRAAAIDFIAAASAGDPILK